MKLKSKLTQPPAVTEKPLVNSNDTNTLLEETFTEMKYRVFKENEEKLHKLMRQYPLIFVGCTIKHHDGLFCSLWRAGTKVLTLINHDITIYDGNGELTIVLRKEYNVL